MSAILTWKNSGLGTKTNTTVASFFTDLNTLVTSKAGDAAFKWQVASVNDAATPFYLVLKRKDASAGRILIVCWTGAPAANNAAILDNAPITSSYYIAWFPAGNVDTPSALTAASGTILGNDTGAVKVAAASANAQVYAALVRQFYFDTSEGVIIGLQNPAAATVYMFGAGDLLVDAADTAYGCTFSCGTNSATWGTANNSPMPWTVAVQNAGSSSTPNVRTNYGAANRSYFSAFAPSGTWAAAAVGATDILTDTALNKAWFAPIQLLGQTKGEGALLKLRQIAYGPGTVGAFSVYNTTGPVTAAQQFNAATAGGNGYAWITDFKL